MRLLFNYIDTSSDRNTDRSSQLVNIYSEVINKNHVENWFCAEIKVLQKYHYKPGMNPLAGIRVKIPIKQEIYKHTHTHTHTHTNNIVQGNFLSGYFGTCIFHKKNATYRRKKE